MSGTEVEIGVWVDGSQKWVSGVTRRTTCHDLIRALLRAQGLRATDADVISHTIVERWKKVERPLDHEQRILKVWRSWGDAVHQVRFSLRRGRSQDTSARDDGGDETGPKRRNRNVDDCPEKDDKENDHQQHHHHDSRDPSNDVGEIGEDGGGYGGTTSLDEAESSCGRSERSRRRHRMRQSRREAGAHQQQQQQKLHPHYHHHHHRRQSPPHAEGSDESVDGAGVEKGTGGLGGDLRRSARTDPRYSETMERLMKLVVAQGETIQTQLRRLSQRETQIETYEQQMHLLRVQNLGTDYLLSSYLHDQQQHQPIEISAGGGGIGQGYPVPHQGSGNVDHYADAAPNGSGGAGLRSQGAELLGTGGPMRPRPRDHELIHGLPPAREVHARPINIQDNGADLYVNNFTDAIPGNAYAENMFCRTNLRSSFDYNPARSSGRLNRISNKDEAISEEKSNDSGVVVGEESLNYSVEEKFHSDFDNLTEVEVQERIVLLSKVEDVLDRLLREEEVIQGLSSTLEVFQTQQMQETAELEADLTRAAEDHSALVAEARKNEQEIRVLDTSAAQKKKLIDALLKDEVDSDQETRYLQAQLDYILHLPPTAFRLPEEGDDPPPLLPPPVLPACLIQSLHPNQPPQLVHPAPATLTSTGLHSSTQLHTAKRRERPGLRQQSPQQQQQRFPVNTYIARPPSPVVLMGHRAPSPLTRAPSPSVRFANRSCSPNKRKPLQSTSYGHLRHSNVTLSSVDVRSSMHVKNNCNFSSATSINNNNNYAKMNEQSLNSANTVNNLVASSLPSFPNRTNPLTFVNNNNNAPTNPNKSSLNNGLIKDERYSNVKRKDLPSYGVNEESSDDTPPPLPSCPPPSLTPPIKTSAVITSSTTTNNITDTLNNNDKSKKIPNNFANDTAKRNFLNSLGGRLQNKPTVSLRHDHSADDEDNDSANTGIGSLCVSSRSSTSSEASISNCSSSASSAPVSSDSGGTGYLKPLPKVNNNLQRMQRITNAISVTTTAKNISSSMRMKEKLINANRVNVGVTTSEKKDVDSADTNSDTGLSSLHSSSDEGGYPLDTLV